MRRWMAATICAVLAAGCASGPASTAPVTIPSAGPPEHSTAASPEPGATAPSRASAGSSPTSASTSTPLPSPASSSSVKPGTGARPAPTPEPEGFVEFLELYLIKWESPPDSVRWNVIQEVINVGDGWARLGVQGDYAISDEAGNVVFVGDLSFGVPEFVGPGETGYLIAADIGDRFTLDDVHSVQASGGFEATDPPAASYPVTKVTYTSHENGDRVSGIVRNDSDDDLSFFEVIAVFLDAQDTPLGYEWFLVEEFPARTSTPFAIDLDRSLEGVSSVRVYGHR
jgi:hypothetical protein